MKTAKFNVTINLPEQAEKATAEQIEAWIKHQFGNCGILTTHPLLHTELADCGIYISNMEIK